MNNYTKDLILDVGKKYLLSPVYAKQGDMASRYLKITMMNGDSQYKPASGNTAKFRALKPDGNSVMNPATINSDGTVTCELTAQTLACAGIVKADVVILDGNSKALASASFDIAVERAPIGEDIESKDEFKEILELIDEASAAVSAANTATSKANTAASSANTAASSANSAAEQALTAKASAEEAAEKANTAADTVAAIDDTAVSTTAWSSKHIVDTLCPEINETGNPVQCYPVEGYPLDVVASWEPTQEGSGDPSPDNIRPITGRDSVQIQACGENLVDIADFTLSVDDNTRAEEFYLPTSLPAGTYVINLNNSNANSNLGIQLIHKEGTAREIMKSVSSFPATVTLTKSLAYCYFYISNTAGNSTAVSEVTITTAQAEYTPYTGTTKTLTLPETIYGGSVANDGAGLKEWGFVSFDGTEKWFEGGATKELISLSVASLNADGIHGKCSTFPYSYNYNGDCILAASDTIRTGLALGKKFTITSWKAFLAEQYAAGTPVQIAYKLAEPTSFTATGGGELTGLDGLNNVLTDADSVTVEGREDIRHTIKELQDALASVSTTEG